MKDYNELYHFSHMIANYYKEEDKDNAYPLKHNGFEIIHVDNVEDRCYCYVKTYYMMLTNIDVFCIEEDKITRNHTSKITPHKIEWVKVQEHLLLENTITTRESQWMPAESVEDYFIKIYRIDVPKMYLGEENGCDVWLVRFFNPIDKKNKIYIHYLKIEGCRCRSVKVYKLILP